MKDVNYPLRKAYYSMLSSITYNSEAMPVFYKQAPDNINLPYYIVFSGLTSNDTSGQYKAATQSSIRVTIHTYVPKYNSGEVADQIANLVYQAIYPNKQTRPDLSADNLQIVSTELSTDNLDYMVMNSREYVDRVLTFSHRIFHQ